MKKYELTGETEGAKRMLKLNEVYNINCLEGLKMLPDKCIDMVITSPPYYKLRDYGSLGEIGQENSYEEYLFNLLEVFKEVKRVLKDEGACWVNIDDVYSKNGLLCIADRFKIGMVESGWLSRKEIIWHKPNAMPSSAKNRFNNDYEKLYFFTKKNKYYFNTQYEPCLSNINSKSTRKGINKSKYHNDKQESAVRQGMNKKRGSKLVFLRKNLPTQKQFVDFMRKRITADTISEETGIKKSKVEHWFRRDTTGFAYPSVEDWNKIKYLVDDFSETFMNIDSRLNEITIETDDILKNSDKGRLKRAVWSINTKPNKAAHFATYPEELIETPIKACCPKNGIVVDPFMGSGTSAVVALKNGCNYIGFELNEEYCKIANDRCDAAKT